MAKSPMSLQLNTNPKVESLEDVKTVLIELLNTLDESYRLQRGDIQAIEERLEDGGL